MIICNSKCSVYRTCKHKLPNQICLYDLGLPKEKDEDDDVLERLMY
jgi:hypothetical protein